MNEMEDSRYVHGPMWQLSITMGESRYEIFLLGKEQLMYIKQHRNEVSCKNDREGNEYHPLIFYPTMRQLLSSLGWKDEPLEFWFHVPPSVQDDWSDVTEDELLDNEIFHTPSPIITVTSK